MIPACSKPAEPARKPKFYQSPMHPWITSDKPGNCTICGMKLVPVYEDKPAGTSEAALEVSARTARVLGLDTAPVLLEPLHKAVRVSGILEDDDTLHRVVAAFYDGRIDQVLVQQVGQKVRAGQPLASIYSPDLLYVVREFQNASARGKADPVAVNARHRLIQFGLSPTQVDGLVSMPKDRYAIDILAPTELRSARANARREARPHSRHEKDFPSIQDLTGCVACGRDDSGVFEACRARAKAEVLPEPDAPVDHLRQAGELHDLRDEAGAGL